MNRFPKSRAALSLLALCYYYDQDYTRAVGLYTRLTELFPAVEDYQIYRVHALLKIGAVAEATDYLSQIHTDKCSQRMLLINVAARIDDEDLDACKGILNDCVPDDPTTICAEATLDFMEGKYDDALAKFSNAYNLIGFEANVAYNVALCHYMLVQHSEAGDIIEEIITRAVEQYPQFKLDNSSNDHSFVFNSFALQESFLVEAYNLKAAIQYNDKNYQGALKIMDSMPQRKDEELDPVSLHNNALFDTDQDVNASFDKMKFLLSNPPFPPVTFKNILTLYCKHGYQDVAADILAENSELAYDLLSQDVNDFFGASIMSMESPDGAIPKFQITCKKLSASIRSLVKTLDDAKNSGNSDEAHTIESDIAKKIDILLCNVMAQASIYWEREDYSMVEHLLTNHAEYCCNHDEWILNMGHCIFAQQGGKFKDCIRYYESFVNTHSPESILQVSPIVLANLCVSYIMNDENEAAEEIMKRVDREEISQADRNSLDAKQHGCIIDLVIGTLYCEKGNYTFGITRICKSLRPFDKKLDADTWYYAKRCFLALADKVAKQMIILKRHLADALFEFLDDVIIYGRELEASIQHETGSAEDKANSVSVEALKLRATFEKLMY